MSGSDRVCFTAASICDSRIQRLRITAAAAAAAAAVAAVDDECRPNAPHRRRHLAQNSPPAPGRAGRAAWFPLAGEPDIVGGTCRVVVVVCACYRLNAAMPLAVCALSKTR